MNAPKREGAILYPTRKQVRLCHEPSGYVYELRETEDGGYFEVDRIDTVLGARQQVGRIRRLGAKLTPEKTGLASMDDALLLVARAWTRLPLLRPKAG